MIERLRALLAAAGPLPWTGIQKELYGAVEIASKSPGGWAIPYAGRIVPRENGELVVAAVNALPALLDVAEAARNIMPNADVNFVFPDDIDRAQALRAALARLEETP